MFESMWSSMTTSIQLAEECLKQSAEANPEKPVNGVHEVAKAIDTGKIDFICSNNLSPYLLIFLCNVLFCYLVFMINYS